MQPVRQRYYTYTGAIFYRLGNNNTESAWQSTDDGVTSDHCRVTVQRLISKFSYCLKRRKIFIPQSADGRVTSDHCRVTVQWLFFKKFLISWNVQKRCLTVGRRSRDLQPLSRDCSAIFFKKFPICLKRPKTLFDSRTTVAWPPTNVAWPFNDFFFRF